LKGGRRPETPIEALMMAAPMTNTQESVMELQPLREAVADCIEQLSEQDQFIIDAINSEMVSLQKLAERMGVSKPHAWRLRNAAYERLSLLLRSNPYIRERLNLDEDEPDYGGI
jgi:DNA-directed RNA polymerase specialized sigma subunit